MAVRSVTALLLRPLQPGRSRNPLVRILPGARPADTLHAPLAHAGEGGGAPQQGATGEGVQPGRLAAAVAVGAGPQRCAPASSEGRVFRALLAAAPGRWRDQAGACNAAAAALARASCRAAGWVVASPQRSRQLAPYNSCNTATPLTRAPRPRPGPHLRFWPPPAGLGLRKDIPMEEVKRHNTRDDAWMVLSGRVYNITPYMAFHPGGAQILMAAAGKDGTSLFQRYHPWVNGHALLEACLLGAVKVGGELCVGRPRWRALCRSRRALWLRAVGTLAAQLDAYARPPVTTCSDHRPSNHPTFRQPHTSTDLERRQEPPGRQQRQRGRRRRWRRQREWRQRERRQRRRREWGDRQHGERRSRAHGIAVTQGAAKTLPGFRVR